VAHPDDSPPIRALPSRSVRAVRSASARTSTTAPSIPLRVGASSTVTSSAAPGFMRRITGSLFSDRRAVTGPPASSPFHATSV
jgi:hypothetical protein